MNKSWTIKLSGSIKLLASWVTFSNPPVMASAATKVLRLASIKFSLTVGNPDSVLVFRSHL